MKMSVAVCFVLVAGSAFADWSGFSDENHICGPKLRPGSLKGKVVLVDKWATWCPPCRAMMPHTEEIVKKFKGRPLIVVGSHVSRGYDKDKVQKFVEENKLSFSFYLDAN